MKSIPAFFIFFLLMSACYLLRQPKNSAVLQPVNAVLGDESFRQTYGRLPDPADPEKVRIATHLAFVEQKLRKERPAGFSEPEMKKREHLLDLLAEYRLAGNFPKNYAYPGERKPCFIDRDGTICAVGYLIEQTSGIALAEKINIMHQYDLIADMDMPELTEWIATSGLSGEECAMIQPAYYTPGPDEFANQNKVSTGYAIASGTLAGLNGAVGFQNFRNIQSGKRNNFLSIVGIAGGAASVTLGITHMNKGKGDYIGTKTNGRFPDENLAPVIGGRGATTDVYSKNPLNATVSWVNITTGAASIALGAWNLIGGKRLGKSLKCPHISLTPLLGSGAVVAFSGTF